MRRLIVFLSCVASLLGLGCNGTISVTFSTGPQEFEVSTDSLALPTELAAEDGTVVALPCDMTGICPPAEVVTLSCEQGVCDPAPETLSVPVGGVIDVDLLLSDSSEIGLVRVDRYTVESVAYAIDLNTLTIPVGPIDVYWGPEAATTIDPALGVARFGTIPAIAAGATSAGDVLIDPGGAAALSDFLVGGGGALRWFAQTVVDLDPGDPYPEGAVRLSVNATVRAEGSILD